MAAMSTEHTLDRLRLRLHSANAGGQSDLALDLRAALATIEALRHEIAVLAADKVALAKEAKALRR
jgi:cell division protein FtsB